MPALCALISTCNGLASEARHEPMLGVDHIPIVVRNLERATQRFKDLGFAIKPGRTHHNGIRNAHIKFPNGAGLELIVVDIASDSLALRYKQEAKRAQGPMFVSFYARDTALLKGLLGNYPHQHHRGLTTLSSPALNYLFILRDNRSPSDQPGHFLHTNTAKHMHAVWLAPKRSVELEGLLKDLNLTMSEDKADSGLEAQPVVPLRTYHFTDSEVRLFDSDSQIVTDRPVIGVTFKVRDVASAAKTLTQTGVPFLSDIEASRRILVHPGESLSMWIEFRE